MNQNDSIVIVGAARTPIGAFQGELASLSAPELALPVVPMAAMADLEIERARINVHGGACALGHPIGASGARIVVTLLGVLRKRGLKKGVAALCIGGGEAT